MSVCISTVEPDSKQDLHPPLSLLPIASSSTPAPSLKAALHHFLYPLTPLPLRLMGLFILEDSTVDRLAPPGTSLLEDIAASPASNAPILKHAPGRPDLSEPCRTSVDLENRC